MRDQSDQMEEALARCASGDRQALRVIFDSEGARMVAVAQRILRRRDLAEDAVQETFLQIWRKAGQYAPDRGSALGWIYAILRNRALNMLRDGRREDLVGDETLDGLIDEGQHDAMMEGFEGLDAQSRLRRCLDGLDEPKRQGILMAYVSGYTHGEIAGRMRVPLGTAKAWVRRGLASLRECMA